MMSLCRGSEQRSPIEAFLEEGGECVIEKLPLEGTQGFQPLQIIYMHRNLNNTLQEREHSQKAKQNDLMN